MVDTHHQLNVLADSDYCVITLIANTGSCISHMPIDNLRTVFQRALNTWPDAPKHLFDLSDNLDQLAQK